MFLRRTCSAKASPIRGETGVATLFIALPLLLVTRVTEESRGRGGTEDTYDAVGV